MAGLPVGLRHIAEQGSNFDLLAHRDLHVIFLIPVEVEQFDIAERTNGADLCRGYFMLRDELLEARHHLFAGGEDDGEGPLTIRDRATAWIALLFSL